MTDVASALEKLATYRSRNNRASQETFDKGVIILRSNVANKMGEEGAFVTDFGAGGNPPNCLTT
jgi:ER membrane protein complex subunit 2